MFKFNTNLNTLSEYNQKKQFNCTYTIPNDSKLTGNINNLKQPIKVKITFPSKQLCAQFINLFDH